jgi:hypothetical protein
MNIEQSVNRYFSARQQLYEAFGYTGDVKNIAICDCRHVHFALFNLKITQDDDRSSLVLYSRYPNEDDFEEYVIVSRSSIFRQGDLTAVLFYDADGFDRIANIAILDSSKEIK